MRVALYSLSKLNHDKRWTCSSTGFLCVVDDGGVNFIKDMPANYTDFRLGRVDKAARWMERMRLDSLYDNWWFYLLGLRGCLVS